MADYTSWAHGLCECRAGCACCEQAGPAALQVRRGDLILKICTRCLLSGDLDRTVLLRGSDEIGTLWEYDCLGMMVLVLGAPTEANGFEA